MIRRLEIPSHKLDLEFNPRGRTELAAPNQEGLHLVIGAIRAAVWGGPGPECTLTLGNGRQVVSGPGWQRSQTRLGQTTDLLKFVFYPVHHRTAAELGVLLGDALRDAATSEQRRRALDDCMRERGEELHPDEPHTALGLAKLRASSVAALTGGDIPTASQVTDAMRAAHRRWDDAKAVHYAAERDHTHWLRVHRRGAGSGEEALLDRVRAARSAMDAAEEAYQRTLGGAGARLGLLTDALRHADWRLPGMVWREGIKDKDLDVRREWIGEEEVSMVVHQGMTWEHDLDSPSRILVGTQLREAVRRLPTCPWWIPIVVGTAEQLFIDYCGPTIACYMGSDKIRTLPM